MHRLFLLLLFQPILISLFGQSTDVKLDSSELQIRTYNESHIDKLKQQKAFQYDVPGASVEPWYTRLWRLFWEWVNSQSGLGMVFQVLFYVLLLFIFILLVMSFLGMSITSVFYKKPIRWELPFNEQEINLYKENFLELIEQAKQEEDYRKALRFSYLWVLKLVNDHHYIHWEKDKTNYEYIREIQDEEVKSLFIEISRSYEFVWYGNFEFDENKYIKFEQTFKELFSKLNEKRVA